MMNFDTPTSTLPLPQALAGALRRLAQLAHTSSWDQWAVQRLTPTQRKILELLVRRGESLSLSAVARELGVTAATACDSVSALESKGLVRKQRSTTDGRALALVLTDEGQHSATQLASLPDPLWGAFDVLADTEQETLYRLSIKMIRGLQENGALPTSRMCLRCKFFDPFRYASSATPHHCHQAQMPFAERQLRIDCSVFEAGDAAAQAELWERFVAQSSEDREPLETVRVIETVRATEPTESIDSLDDEDSADVPASRGVEPSNAAVAVAAASGHPELLTT
jgi:DNA-binding MarR family transcriptional regulator